MKIALLHYAAPPIIGGVEGVIAHHARLMADDGHTVRIIAGRGAQFDGRIAYSIVPEVDSRHPEVLALKAQLDAGRIPPGFEPYAERIAARLQPLVSDTDVAIAHNVCSLNKNLALTVALHRLSENLRGIRFILWHHDLAWTTQRYRSELHDGYPWDLLRTDWPWASQVVVSAQRRSELAALLGVTTERIQVIPNGLDAREFLKLDDETERLRERLRLSLAAPLVLLPARITPRKNIELALRVLYVLRQEFTNAALVVTGPLGPHNPANQQYFERLLALRSQLRLDGAAHFLAEVIDHPIPDNVIVDLYKLADLLVLPSREEGFGIPILEAGLAGVPVFCSDIAAIHELGGPDVTYFSPEDEPARIAGQIGAMLKSSSVYALRKRVLRDFTWRQIYRNRIGPLLMKAE